MSEKTKQRHLPPPAFPRVIRDSVRESSMASTADDDLSTSSNDAIPGHEVNVRRGVYHKSELGTDSDITELVEVLSNLADTLKREGEAGLVTQSGISRLDSMLRSYCQGYLTGRRIDEG